MRILVVFNLKKEVEPAAYEEWARTIDLPTVRNLDSIADFKVWETVGVLGSDAPAPYQYVEMIKASDDEAFGADVASETMKRVAAEFQELADAPQFLILLDIETSADGAL